MILAGWLVPKEYPVPPLGSLFYAAEVGCAPRATLSFPGFADCGGRRLGGGKEREGARLSLFVSVSLSNV